MGWKFEHNPEDRPLGCNGKYGSSGYKRHKREGTEPCAACLESKAHYTRELRRGQGYPNRTLVPCGERSAAVRHRRRGEPVDFKCRAAEARHRAKYMSRQRARERGVGAPTPTVP